MITKGSKVIINYGNGYDVGTFVEKCSRTSSCVVNINGINKPAFMSEILEYDYYREKMFKNKYKE